MSFYVGFVHFHSPMVRGICRFVRVEGSFLFLIVAICFVHAFVWCCEACSFVAVFGLLVRLPVFLFRFSDVASLRAVVS